MAGLSKRDIQKGALTTNLEDTSANKKMKSQQNKQKQGAKDQNLKKFVDSLLNLSHRTTICKSLEGARVCKDIHRSAEQVRSFQSR